MTDRVIAYIDGFNLYFGLKDRGWKQFYWLDVTLLVENLLKKDQQLEKVIIPLKRVPVFGIFMVGNHRTIGFHHEQEQQKQSSQGHRI